ncbi:MAG: hypothetical protein QXI19_02210 [Candidatus Caldarchaeum sp.]
MIGALERLERIVKARKRPQPSGKGEEAWSEAKIPSLLHEQCSKFLARNEFWRIIIGDISEREAEGYSTSGWDYNARRPIYYVISLKREFCGVSLLLFIYVPIVQVSQEQPDVIVTTSVYSRRQESYANIIVSREDDIESLEKILEAIKREAHSQAS